MLHLVHFLINHSISWMACFLNPLCGCNSGKQKVLTE
ncbi:hypothetical protein CLOL250_01058 [Clostridium sp. L2-50]|nr:hypothetical protein CLOL250_01058 [Clostridium sp. L2-50]